jgi:hypothetical protein
MIIALIAGLLFGLAMTVNANSARKMYLEDKYGTNDESKADDGELTFAAIVSNCILITAVLLGAWLLSLIPIDMLSSMKNNVYGICIVLGLLTLYDLSTKVEK